MARLLKGEKSNQRPSRDAQETRTRILGAAKLRFCKHSYEQVGVREIAGDANVDAAMVNRYFGTKEELFAEAAKGVFNAENFIEGPPGKLGEYLARRLVHGSGGESKGGSGINPFELLLRSAASPTASPIIAQRLHTDFVLRLAALIGGRHAAMRAALVASYIIGFLTVRIALQSPAIGPACVDEAAALLGSAIQSAIDELK